MAKRGTMKGATYVGLIKGDTQEERIKNFIQKYRLNKSYQYQLESETFNPNTMNWYLKLYCVPDMEAKLTPREEYEQKLVIKGEALKDYEQGKHPERLMEKSLAMGELAKRTFDEA